MRLLRLVRRDLTIGFKTMAGVAISLTLTIVLYVCVAGIAYGNVIGNLEVYGEVVSYLEFLAPGLMAIAAVESSFIIGSLYWLDRRIGMLEQILAGPYTRRDYVASKVITAVVFSLAYSLLVMMLLAAVNWDLSYVVKLLESLLIIPLASITFSSLGLAVAQHLKSPETYNMALNTLLIPLFFLSPAYYPENALPPIIHYITLANPLTYIVESMRALILTSPAVATGNAAVVAALAAITLATATAQFNKAEVAG